MENVDPLMRLKVKGDTFFIPEAQGGVYFRNNQGSFSIDGRGMYQWMETLIPVFDGTNTLEQITDGLPNEYRNRVYDLANLLYRNGFVRDVSRDHSHHLPDELQKMYLNQIELLDNLLGSGPYRFQSYRETRVLAVGDGPILVSLITSLFNSGLPRLHFHMTDRMPSHRQRLSDITEHYRKADAEVALTEIEAYITNTETWRQVIQSFDAILYASEIGNIEQLRMIQEACRTEHKVFIPAICYGHVGLAGPIVHPDADGCWESAWRRIHQSTTLSNERGDFVSAISAAMMANVIVFEWFKLATGFPLHDRMNQCFLMKFETLEGQWHVLQPHPLVTGLPDFGRIEEPARQFKASQSRNEPNALLQYFQSITSQQFGIFHVWEEGDLKQLPLALCRIQTVDPLSDGPADLLPSVVCAGFTHTDARREAGMAGIEMYVSRLTERFTAPLHAALQNEGISREGFVGVGAGETIAECVYRGLKKCVLAELEEEVRQGIHETSVVDTIEIEDETCQFYWKAIHTPTDPPQVCLGENPDGFSVIWVRSNGEWFVGADLNHTLALRDALQRALLHASHPDSAAIKSGVTLHELFKARQAPNSITIPQCSELDLPDALGTVLQQFKQNRKRVVVVDLAVESFLKEGIAGVVGVVVRKEERM